MVDPTVIGAGIAERMAGIEAALARQQSFVVAPGDPAAEGDAADDVDGVVEHLVLRAMRTAADPVNHRLLGHLRAADVSLTALSDRLGASRVVTWERVGDLVQCGLVARSVERDSIGLTGAGGEFAAFVAETMAAAASAAAARSAGGAP